MTVTEIINGIKTAAHQSKTEYIDVLRRFFEDEFFRRLSIGEFSKVLILRGGFLVWQLTDFMGISSRDLDFLLLNGDDDITEKYIYDMVLSIIGSEGENDIIGFECDNVKRLDEVRQYRGFSVGLTGVLGKLRVSFKINIGIGDRLYHQPESMVFPATLSGFSDPEVNVYPVESIISEKLDMLLCRLGLNDCMKHLYDIYLLSRVFDFDGYELQRALTETLKTRNNDSSADALAKLEELTADEYLIQHWRHFSRINNIDATFEEVISRTVRFAEPIWDAIKREGRWQQSWSGVSGRWEDNIYLY